MNKYRVEKWSDLTHIKLPRPISMSLPVSGAAEKSLDRLVRRFPEYFHQDMIPFEYKDFPGHIMYARVFEKDKMIFKHSVHFHYNGEPSFTAEHMLDAPNEKRKIRISRIGIEAAISPYYVIIAGGEKVAYPQFFGKHFIERTKSFEHTRDTLMNIYQNILQGLPVKKRTRKLPIEVDSNGAWYNVINPTNTRLEQASSLLRKYWDSLALDAMPVDAGLNKAADHIFAARSDRARLWALRENLKRKPNPNLKMGLAGSIQDNFSEAQKIMDELSLQPMPEELVKFNWIETYKNRS